jgi:hypothetical protein
LEAGNGIGAAFFGNLFDEELLIFYKSDTSKREAKKKEKERKGKRCWM